MTENRRKIGIFDSGLGGLYIANAIRALMPQYDYVYLGDTLHVPYGGRSHDLIYRLSESAMRYLINKQECDLIIVACNTASVAAVRRLQQEFLATNYPEKRILSVVIPTLETATMNRADTTNPHKIGLIATQYTVQSRIYEEEIAKITPNAQIFSVATPLLVPLIEHHGNKYIDAVLTDYLAPLLEQKINSLILGCTHYVALKNRIRTITGSKVDILAQDDIIPHKLQEYLSRHPEMENRLSQNATFTLKVTDMRPDFVENAAKIITHDRPDIETVTY